MSKQEHGALMELKWSQMWLLMSTMYFASSVSQETAVLAGFTFVVLMVVALVLERIGHR